MSTECCLCHDTGAVDGCPCCGLTAKADPIVAAWAAAQGVLEAALPGLRPALAYRTSDSTAWVRVGGRVVAEVEASDAVTAIHDVTALALRFAEDEEVAA